MINQEMKYPGATRVLVWRLEEDAPQLLALCQQRDIPCEDLINKPVKRQREMAAERLLLCEAFGRPVALSHDQQGAPRVEGETVNISISHTPLMVALALNADCVIGLDAEQMDRQQVLRVRTKYLNTSEQQFIAPDDLPAHVLAWTAKEAVILIVVVQNRELFLRFSGRKKPVTGMVFQPCIHPLRASFRDWKE